MYNLNEIVVDYRCKWTQHLLRMNDTFPNLHMNTFQPAEETQVDLEREAHMKMEQVWNGSQSVATDDDDDDDGDVDELPYSVYTH